MTDLFTDAQLRTLRAEYGRIERVDPTGPAYRRMIAFLDAAGVPALRQLRDARVPFLSRLAANRVPADH